MSEQRLLVMPKLGLTMTEGVVTEWRKRENERFDLGDVIVVIESDKTAFDVEAPAAGALGQRLVQENETAPVGALLAHWRLDGEPAGAADATSGQAVLSAAKAPSIVSSVADASAPPPF